MLKYNDIFYDEFQIFQIFYSSIQDRELLFYEDLKTHEYVYKELFVSCNSKLITWLIGI
jgi:hypothetical protein